MATLVYKMTHTGDPDSDLGWWGVSDCMGQVRGFPFDAVIGISGRSWWTNQTRRRGEIVWIGVGPEKVDEENRGPVLRFARFRHFGEGEQILSEIAPELDKSMHFRRFRLYAFSRIEEQEIEQILKLALKAGPSASCPQATKTQSDGDECRPKLRRRRTRCTNPRQPE
jgi:hypothetical protein